MYGSWTQRTHDAVKTSLLRENDVAMPFWRNNDTIIASCTHWKVKLCLVCLVTFYIFAQLHTTHPKNYVHIQYTPKIMPINNTPRGLIPYTIHTKDYAHIQHTLMIMPVYNTPHELCLYTIHPNYYAHIQYTQRIIPIYNTPQRLSPCKIHPKD